MSRETSRASKAAPAAGGGSPGTTDARAAEPAAEALARAAEAVTQPGEDVGEILAAQRDVPELVMTHVFVRASADGYRRCGRAWPAAGVEVSVDDFTAAELERLFRDPGLLVLPVCRPLPAIETE